MKSCMLLSSFLKIGSWKKLFLCGKKSLEKPTVELSREIIEWEILPRLPVESLCRFMCVCKQWKSHISTCDQFTRKNLQHIIKQSLTHRKVLEIDNSSQTFSTHDCGDLINHDSTIVRSIPFVSEAQEVLLLATLEGLVFVEFGKIGNEAQLSSWNGLEFTELVKTREYAFWNPLTGAYKNLSNSPKFYSRYDAFALYFDSNKKDYKVLQLICVDGDYKALVYSQRPNSTKEIQWSEDHRPGHSYSLWSTPISFSQSLYFIGKSHSASYHQFWIIVFDVKSEKIREIRFPLLNQENTCHGASLMVIKGCIHICFSRCLEVGGELWRMDGDGDGWTKVKDFPPAGNHPWTYEDKIIDIKDLAPLNFSRWERSRRTILYLETLVSPVSC